MFRKRKPETDVDEIEPEATETKITVGGSSVFPIELSLAVASALGPPLRGPARSRRAQDLPGLQVRGNGGDSLLPGFHHQVPPLHRARTPQDRAGSHEGKRFVMSCSPFDLKDYFLQELPSPQRRPGGSPRQSLSRLPRRAGAPAVDRGGSLLFARRGNSAAHRLRQRPDFRAFARAALAQRLLGIHGAPGVRLRRHALRVDCLFCCHPSGSRAGSHGGRSRGRRVVLPRRKFSSRSSRPSPRQWPQWRRARPKRTRNWSPISSARATKR